jgi:hypothetical protein
MIRDWLRHWLGFSDLWNRQIAFENHAAPRIDALAQADQLRAERLTLAWERIVAMEVEHSALSKKQAELAAILQEVRQLREMLADPKRQPIATRTTHQFRALMEQE